MFPEFDQEVPVPDRTITIYTDGSCSGNPGPGGWAAVVISEGQVRELSGYEPETTNNRMELMAAIQALESLAPGSSVTLYSDSEYVIHGITKWIAGWKRRNWRTKSKDPVKNLDLWQRLDHAVKFHTIAWKWVKGHAGNKYNEIVDTLANSAVNAAR